MFTYRFQYCWKSSLVVHTHTHTELPAAHSAARRPLLCHSFSQSDETLSTPAAYHRHHHLASHGQHLVLHFSIVVGQFWHCNVQLAKLQPSPRCQPRPASRPPLRPTAAKQNGTSCYFVYDHEIRWKSAVPLAQRAAVGGRGYQAPQPGPQHHHRHGHVQAMMRSKCGSGGADSGLGAWGPGSGTAPARCALLRASRRCVSV